MFDFLVFIQLVLSGKLLFTVITRNYGSCMDSYTMPMSMTLCFKTFFTNLTHVGPISIHYFYFIFDIFLGVGGVGF